MAVIEYKEYEHGAGFVGFRAARTVGVESDYRQKYFSLNEYSYGHAKTLAHRLDKKWATEAEEVLKIAVRKPYKRRNIKKNSIADGFRAFIETTDKLRATGEIRTYFSPCFVVNVPRSGKHLSFRIGKLGYETAFKNAVQKYTELHNLNKKKKAALLVKLPDMDVFTGYLLKNLRQRGHKLPKKTLLEMLNPS